jgi:hypothetical protein
VSFIWLYLWTSANPATDWFYHEAMSRSMVLREAVIAAIIVWAVWRMMNNGQLPTLKGHPHEETEELLLR